MTHFEKYCVDDFMTTARSSNEAINKAKAINNAILILEQYTNTSQHYRQKVADAIRNLGVLALSKYLLHPHDYESFFSAAKQEQKERLKNRSLNEIEQHPYTPLDKQFQATKQKYEACEKKFTYANQAMVERHNREIENLKSRHAQEIQNLQKEKRNALNKVQKEIKEIEHQIKLQNNPEYAAAYYAEQKRKQEEQERIEAELRFLQSFDIRIVKNEDRKQLFPILRKLSLNERLSEEDVAWLETTGKEDYFSKNSKIYQAYHRIEAEYFIGLFNKQKNVWHAVNASSHLRKVQAAQRAETLLENISQNKITDKKLKSAFLTTFGGVKRDLDKFKEGITMAESAHKLSSKDYRPCTLLGALHFEIREYETGSEWFDKAENLGASRHNTDAEIKALYHKANKEGKAKLKAYLLKLNPKRYAWLEKSKTKA